MTNENIMVRDGERTQLEYSDGYIAREHADGKVEIFKDAKPISLKVPDSHVSYFTEYLDDNIVYKVYYFKEHKTEYINLDTQKLSRVEYDDGRKEIYRSDGTLEMVVDANEVISYYYEDGIIVKEEFDPRDNTIREYRPDGNLSLIKEKTSEYGEIIKTTYYDSDGLIPLFTTSEYGIVVEE